MKRAISSIAECESSREHKTKLRQAAEASSHTYAKLTQELQTLRNTCRYSKAATFFGGGKTHSHWDGLTFDLAKELAAKHHYFILSGGGNGTMKAANEGALAGKSSATAAIRLNGLNEGLGCQSAKCHEFCATTFPMRKQLLMESSDLMVFMPGGIGTFDELFAVACYEKKRRWEHEPLLRRFRTVLVGREFWTPMKQVLMQMMAPTKDENPALSAASPSGRSLVADWHIIDTVEEMMHLLQTEKDRLRCPTQSDLIAKTPTLLAATPNSAISSLELPSLSPNEERSLSNFHKRSVSMRVCIAPRSCISRSGSSNESAASKSADFLSEDVLEVREHTHLPIHTQSMSKKQKTCAVAGF